MGDIKAIKEICKLKRYGKELTRLSRAIAIVSGESWHDVPIWKQYKYVSRAEEILRIVKIYKGLKKLEK